MWSLGLWLDYFTPNLNMSVTAYGEIKRNYVKKLKKLSKNNDFCL